MSLVVVPDTERHAGHVLIIEDDDVTRLLETISLERSGWVVSEAATGREGVAVAVATLPEVVICDRRLPDLDGLEVIAALAGNVATSSIPIVMVTGMGEADEIVRGIDAGAHDYVVKPFKMVELEVRCRAALRVSRQHRLLARSELELRLLSENTTDLVLRIAMDGVIRYVSASSRRLLGWDPAELVGQPASVLCHPGDDPALSALRDARPGEVVSVTRRMLRVDGGYIWVDSRKQVIVGPDGDLEVLSASRDITERLASAAALAESERAYRRIVDLAAEGVCVVDSQQKITFANARMGELLGVPAAELLGRSPLEFTDDEGETAGATDVNRSPAGISGSGDLRFLRSDGAPVWTSFNAAPIIDEHGAVQGSIALVSDVTQRHLHEEALTAAEERWRAAFEQAPVGMAQIGVDGWFVRVNPALAAMLGYPAEQLLTMTPVELTHPDDADRAGRAIDDVIANRTRPFRDEKRFLHARGHVVWCAVSAVPVHDSDGRVDHLLVHYLDISELKRVETELQHLAVHDPLTGLLNRRGFDVALTRHVAHVDRYGPDGALIVLDLDGLKAINDAHGHEAGDRAIATVADILRRRLRSTDTIARLGGDEYAVILPHANRDQAKHLAATLLKAIRRDSSSGDPSLAVTASVGVAMFDTRRSAEDIVSAADAAMYAAKSAGRDRLAFQDQPSAQRGCGGRIRGGATGAAVAP